MLGDTLLQVETLHGKSRFNGRTFAYVDLGWGGLIEDNRVKLLVVLNPSPLKTADGIGIGSTRVEVQRQFGIAEDVALIDGLNVHWYFKKGINFGYGANARVAAITVFRPI